MSIHKILGLGPPLLQQFAGRAAKVDCNLAVGQPEMDPPVGMDQALMESMLISGHARYTGAGGNTLVADALVDYFRDLGLRWIGTDDVLMTHGAKLMVDVAVRALCSPESHDLVLWFGPGYTYERMAILNNLIPSMVETDENFSPDLDSLREAISQGRSAGKTGVLIINNPVNPTGRVWSIESLLGIVEILRSVGFDLTIIADETYGDLTYEGSKFVPFATLPGMAERTVTIRSGSKESRIPGYRAGYVAGPEDVIKAMRVILGDCVGCPNTLTQAAVVCSISEHRAHVAEQMPALITKRQIISDWCMIHNLVYAPMDGAFYAFVNFKPLLDKLGATNTTQLSEFLLEKSGVGIVPGEAFGSRVDGNADRFLDWARISYAGSEDDLREGLKRIGKFFE